MLSLITRADIGGALANTNLDVDLRALIGLRAWQLYVLPSRSHVEPVGLFVVQGGDTADVIRAALGFDPAGGRAEASSYTWLEDHGPWFEIFYTREDGPIRVFVENGPGTELGIHYLCLAHFWTEGEGETS